MEKRGTRICFVLELKTEWVGGIEKELNLNETKVGMGLNLKDERSWNPKEVCFMKFSSLASLMMVSSWCLG